MDYSEVKKHDTEESCWVILYDHVYDVTSFLPEHPGGSNIVLALAGQDATEEYDPVHPPGTLEENLPSSANLGKIDKSTLPSSQKIPQGSESQAGTAASDTSSQSQQPTPSGPPPLDSLLNLDDIEAAAKPSISQTAWAYYYSASDDLYTKTLNNTVYQSILLRPRIFVDCTKCSTSTSLLGHSKSNKSNPLSHPINVDLPLFVSPAAMGRLAHPSGEKGMADACAKFNACQIISNNASLTPEQILEDAGPDQIFGWQLYVQTDRSKSEKMLERINALAQIKFIVLTLDAAVPGKREHDERVKNVGAGLSITSAVQNEGSSSRSKPPGGGSSGGVGKSLFAGTAADLTWHTTLPWLAKNTSKPIVLKGLQTHEDAYLASLYTPQVRGIILSNHGGRAMDTAPPPLHTLMEIRKYVPEVLDKVDVWVDGGIKRGTDVVKALCLGASAVGIGRAPLWGLGVGGAEGVGRVLEILKAEIETCMRLLGCQKVEDLGMQHINTRALERDIYDGSSNLEKIGLWAQTKAEMKDGLEKVRAKL